MWIWNHSVQIVEPKEGHQQESHDLERGVNTLEIIENEERNWLIENVDGSYFEDILDEFDGESDEKDSRNLGDVPIGE